MGLTNEDPHWGMDEEVRMCLYFLALEIQKGKRTSGGQCVTVGCCWHMNHCAESLQRNWCAMHVGVLKLSTLQGRLGINWVLKWVHLKSHQEGALEGAHLHEQPWYLVEVRI